MVLSSLNALDPSNARAVKGPKEFTRALLPPFPACAQAWTVYGLAELQAMSPEHQLKLTLKSYSQLSGQKRATQIQHRVSKFRKQVLANLLADLLNGVPDTQKSMLAPGVVHGARLVNTTA